MSKKFEYKYSAPTILERKEIESIRSHYLPKDSSVKKLEKLKKLDKKVRMIPNILSLIIGTIGILVFGLGMTYFLLWIDVWYVGIVFFILGVILMIFSYPIYQKISNYLKEKYSEEIIKLSNELLNKKND